MRFGSDGRAQSTLVGAILLFAILIIAFSSYQAFVVPNQNAEVEFNHNLQAQDDMQDLRNSLLDVRSVQDGEVVSEHRPVRVRLGTQFPERLIALNPPTPSGTLESDTAESEFRIENAEVDGNFDGQPADRLLGPDPSADLGTTFLSYSPGYTEYREAPQTTLEHSLLYNEFPSANITVREQTLIRPDSNRLNIVLFDGDVSQSSSQGVTLDPETLDGPTATVPIEPEDGTGDISLQIPTQNPEVWNETVDELANVTLDDQTESSVTVSLTDGRYTLRATRVGFNGGVKGGPLSDIQPVDQSGGGESDPSVYNTNWDTDSIVAEDQNIFLDGETLVVQQGELENADSIDGFVSVVDAANVENAIAQADVDIGSSNRDVANPPDSGTIGETEDDGAVTAGIDISIGDATLFAASGDNADRLPIDVRANIKGTVSDNNGDPIEDATVEIEETGDTAMTDTNGEYVLVGISAGTYEVTADAEGFEPRTIEVDVSEDEANDPGVVADQDITLEEEVEPGFENVDATDVPRNDTPSSQTFSFTLDQTLEQGETVVIDLSDPQGGSIDYQDSSVDEANSDLNQGSASFTIQEENNAEITYTAEEDIIDSQQIQIEVDNVDYPNGNLDVFDVIFDRSDGGSESTTFSDFN